MKHDRIVGRVLGPSLALVALAALLVLLGLAVTGPARAATTSPKPKATAAGAAAATPAATPASVAGAAVQRGAEVRAGEDILVPRGTTVPSVAAFGGDVTVNGTVTDAVVAFGGNVKIDGKVGSSVVAFGGDITVDGSVGASVVAFGGDVTLGPTARVGARLGPRDASVVALGGNLTRAPGARVHGLVKHSVTGFHWGDVAGWAGRGLFFSPLLGLNFFGWVIQTAFFLVLALVAAALMPGALRRVQVQVRSRPWASLGWGALAFWVAVPVTFLALLITVIGLLLWLPLAVFVLLVYFFGSVALVALLAQKVLWGFGGRENLMLSVALGVVGTTVLSRVPVAGVVLVFVMIWVGTGGVILAVVQRRRERKEAAAAEAAAAAVAPGGWQYPRSAEATTAAVITPIVQTSPAQQAAAQTAYRTAHPVMGRPAAASAAGPPAEAQSSDVFGEAPRTPPLPPTAPAPAAPAPPATPEAPVTPEAPAGARPAEDTPAPGEPGPRRDDAPKTGEEGGPQERPGT